MSFKSELIEDNSTIADSYFMLMDRALSKGVCVSIEKHIDSKNKIVLYVKCFRLDDIKRNVIYSNIGYSHDQDDYYMVRNFIDSYSNETH